MEIREITLTIRPGGRIEIDASQAMGPGQGEIVEWLASLVGSKAELIRHEPGHDHTVRRASEETTRLRR